MRRNSITAIMAITAVAALGALGIDVFGPTANAAAILKLDGQGRRHAPPATRFEKQTLEKAKHAQNVAVFEAIGWYRATQALNVAKLLGELNRQERAKAEQAAREGRLRQQRTTVAVRQSARPKPPPPQVTFNGDLRALVASYPWDVGTANTVVWCESRWNPSARNRSGATGLFQILGGPLDPKANVERAYEMYRTRGWQPWNASKRCWS